MFTAWIGSLALCLGAPDDSIPKDVKTAALAATVRVGQGSGVIIARDGPVVYILTANHVLGERDRVPVWVLGSAAGGPPDRGYPAVEVFARTEFEDLALLRLYTRDKLPDPVRLCPPKAVPRGRNIPVVAVGCDTVTPTCYCDVVRQRDIVRENKGKQAVRFWEAEIDPANQRSGGPIVDKDKRLLGVCSGGTDGKGYYCHTDEIHKFLSRYRLESLFDDEGKKKASR